MALTVINTPIGHKLTGLDIEANIYNDGTGRAIVYTGTSHGLSDGDYVYIQSDFDSYNGFKYVDSTAYDYFLIKESENADYTQYVQDAEIDYQVSILEHGFLAVHQPIVYEIESDIYPVNQTEEAYLPNTVVSQADSDGYTQINLQYALSDPTELAKIELVGEGPLAGVYQIITVLQPWSVVIDLAYDAANDFSGYVIVKYYDNYAINVNVYAGLTSDHRWEDIKPFELAATLKFLPDSSGRTKFSISDLLRAYINNRNNLTLDTLPNNLDFIVSFYIEYFESYDESDGETITTHETSIVESDFVGHALNSKLEFKTESISHLSDYINEGNYLAQWLTLFDRPILLYGHFFDLSFINQYNGFDLLITRGGVPYLTIENPGYGVIRVPIEAESGDSEICIAAYIDNTANVSLAGFTNRGLDPDVWVTGSTPSITIASIFGGNSDYLWNYISLPPGNYIFTLLNNDLLTGSLTLSLRDSSFNSIDSDVQSLANPGDTLSFSVTVTEDTDIISFRLSSSTGVNNSFSNLAYTPESPLQIIEEICIDVIQECESTYIPDDARLLEDGGFRLLE